MGALNMSDLGLAHRLLSLRKARNLLQADVAAAVGISRPFLSALETGADVPGRGTLVALAQYYNVSLDWLAGGQGALKPGAASAQNDDEALWLYAFRELPPDEARLHLQLLLKRVGGNAQ